MEVKKGKFIVVEGIDGCGKGELAKRLANYLFDLNKKHHIFLTREPYISGFSEEIRRLLRQTADPKDNGELFTELFVKDRKVHSAWIKKELQAGHFVVSDRFKYSTIAYEGAQGVAMEKIIKMHKGILAPDLIIIIDVPVRVTSSRMDKDGKREYKEVFEREEYVSFREKVRSNYLMLPKYLPKEKFAIIDGSKSLVEVFEAASEEVKNIL